ncbi:MAG: putative drug exporter of the superfamily, partial [Thermoleophilaceae bacterium]|nr:putative drug exporter of the superfamily [Thermoleophilaceae bacterium]
MHAAMDRLERLTARHGRIVLIVWVLILLASLPFAARQTDHLTSGGFTVPGSGSDSVDRGLAAFDRGGSQQLAGVVARRQGATDADVRAAVDR